jgi:uncharacterized protein (TIGR02145 family)
MSSPDIGLSISNPADPHQGAVVYTGIAATLNVALTNNTGADITLASSGQASTLEIFMPSFFTFAEVQAMQISLSGWTFSVDSADQSLLLTYSGTDGSAWSAGANIAFSITNVESTAQPFTDSIQIDPSNMSGTLPLQVEAPLSLALPPQPGNANLPDTLQVSLDTEGTVYVSQSGDPLANTLFLNFKNTGSTPIYSGTSQWQARPQVIISFVYGQTAGSLAQDSDQASPGVGSAWNIAASIAVSEGNAWQPVNPNASGVAGHPSWILEPVATNQGIIGTDDSANIKFQFQQIVSLTPMGNTQMVVHFTGFPKDDQTVYNDHVFILNITKLAPPATRGLLSFFSPASTVTVTDPNASVSFNFSWSMFQVDSIALSWNGATAPLLTANYEGSSGAPPPLGYDHKSVSLPYATIVSSLGPSKSESVLFTLNGYDGNGNELNSLQFTVAAIGEWRALSLASSVSQAVIYDPAASLTLTLSWTMFEVATAAISWSVGSGQPVPLKTVSYTPPQLSGSDQTSIQIPITAIAAEISSATSGATSGTVVFTLDSFDVNGNPLTTPTCSVSVSYLYFVDPRDQKAYITTPVGNLLWMAQNLDWNTGDSNSFLYGNSSANEVPYGRLYTQTGANEQVPAGWRIPTADDWNALFTAYGTYQNGDYLVPALMAGGSSGFNALLCGTYGGAEYGFQNMGVIGACWAGGDLFAVFVDGAAAVAGQSGFSFEAVSLRYVKDL